jgi:hypothetical protein
VNFLPVYLDSSAIVKLVVLESGTTELLAELDHWPDRVSSSMARVEVHRALRRAGASPALRVRADAVLSSLALLRVDDMVLARAASFRDPMLRTLDAIHLATALSLGDAPEAFVTYDARLARAATRQRLRVVSPGVEALTSQRESQSR